MSTSASSGEATGAEAATLNKQAKEKEEEEKDKLPPLSPHEFRQYNRLAEHMNYFHEHFRHTWNTLWTAATTNKRPAGMSIRSFIAQGLQFISQLEVHHGIEEQHIFPILARKMPEFRQGKGNGAAELLRQHKEIHKGMDLLQAYLQECQTGEKDLDMPTLKSKMESWGGVLWKHLDQEVETLGAENMRKYWTIEEIRRIPM
ncbi:uncharacterized protein B0I36DRAFT_371715 [Microdochium trichocladiopsis]|uniref:Hemerythrin-like domain-containing protein n=1 Tax=Microdochium trichocladiopsis TaxID=1682393 RepID=A0A9P8YK83_9PEZI|nr:uncharacterized protein B0I36DRAFT_371715 [Microdochium trichocladiopsis]KAH7041558.1 hypothetical protein B0I36DRAFT_371715 [Microdochium trichocladiopsis]